jgi:hypothetical protein
VIVLALVMWIAQIASLAIGKSVSITSEHEKSAEKSADFFAWRGFHFFIMKEKLVRSCRKLVEVCAKLRVSYGAERGVIQMATYNVKVVVEYQYEVEVDTEAEAEAEGWKYEEYKHTAQVDSIDVEEVESDDDYENDSDDADSEWLASAGFGNDEDYE